MAARTSSTPISVIPASTSPRGDRPPRRPDLPLLILRAVWLVCLLVVLLRGPLQWAVDHVPQPVAPLHTSPALPQVTGADPWAWIPPAAARTRAVLESRWMRVPAGMVVAGLSLLGLELAANALLLVIQTRGFARVGTSYAQIRTPQPPLSGQSRAPSAPSAEDLYHLLHRVLPWTGGYGGGRHWFALTLSAVPDEPVELGIVMSGGRAADRQTRLATVRKLLRGLDASAVLDARPDPLQVAATPGRVVIWREYTLFHPPSYPLRLPDDAQTDLLAPLLAALRGRRGTAYTEYHLTLRPRNDFDLTNGWRVYALRRLLQLRAKHQYYMNPDMDALQAKIDNPAYDLSVRVVVVADAPAQVAVAETELDEIERVLLGQFQARSGTYLQRFRAVGGRRLPMTDALLAGVSGRTRMLGRVLGLTIVGAGMALWLRSGNALPLDVHALWQQPTLLLPLLLPMLQGSLGLALLALLPAWGLARRNRAQLHSRWRRLLARAPRATPTAPIMLPLRAWRMPSVVSTIELSGLWHLPTAGMGLLVRWQPARILPAPPAVFVPDGAPEPSTVAPPPPRACGGFLRRRASASPPRLPAVLPALTDGTRPHDPWLTLGLAQRSDGSRAPVGIRLSALRKILHITAGMGAGKTRLLANLCQQLMPTGFMLADGKGDDDQGSLVAVVRRLIPLADEGRVAILDILDTDWPIGINPIGGVDLTRPGGVDMALGQVLAIFARLDPEVWGKSMGMQQFIRTGALLVFEAQPNPTMAHIKQALIDAVYREQLLKRCTNIEVKSYWTVTFPQTSEQQKTSLDALLRRFDNLLLTETTRYLLTQSETNFDFRRAMDDGTIVLVPMPDMTLGGMAGLVGMLTVQAIVRAAFGRQGSDQSRATYPLIIDEFQVFLANGANEDVSTAITRLRSLGIASIYAHQSLAQLGELQATMQINVGNRVIMKTGEPDASVYAKQYAASGLTAQDIANQDASAQQYAVLDVGGLTVGPLSMEPLGWPEPLALTLSPTDDRDDRDDWQAARPQPAEAADDALCALAYGAYTALHLQRLVCGLAQLPADEWAYLHARWAALANVQRARILADSASVPDGNDRQRWLSRLQYATPRALAAARYQRARWLTQPGSAPVKVAPKARIGSRGAAPSVFPAPPRDWNYGTHRQQEGGW